MAVSQIHGGRQIQSASIDKTRVNADIIRADGVNAFTADHSHGGFKITNLANGVAASDAATVGQVDQARSGIQVKDPVRVASTANLTLSGTQTVDGVSLSAGNRILVKDQSTAANNGIYVVAAGAWARSTDADVDPEIKAGMMCWVNEGTTNGDKQFILTSNDPITIGTTPLTFTLFAGGTSYTAGNALTLTGSTFDVVPGDTSLTVAADNMSVNVVAAGGLEVSSGVKVKLDGATLAISASGTKVADAGITATQLASSVAGNGLTGGAGTALAVNTAANGGLQITSDAVEIKLNGSSLSVGASGLSVNTSKFVVRETPGGTLNGSNVTFTIANALVAGSEQLYLNGLLLEPGAGNDYTISSQTVTMLTAPLSTDRLKVSYIAS